MSYHPGEVGGLNNAYNGNKEKYRLIVFINNENKGGKKKMKEKSLTKQDGRVVTTLLTRNQYGRLAAMAVEEETSLSTIIRRAVRLILTKNQGGKL
jgi:hypothetical protein